MLRHIARLTQPVGARGSEARAIAVYARRGLVFDGIDNGQVSRNSGAESNIEGALALLSSARAGCRDSD